MRFNLESPLCPYESFVSFVSFVVKELAIYANLESALASASATSVDAPFAAHSLA